MGGLDDVHARPQAVGLACVASSSSIQDSLMHAVLPVDEMLAVILQTSCLAHSPHFLPRSRSRNLLSMHPDRLLAYAYT